MYLCYIIYILYSQSKTAKIAFRYFQIKTDLRANTLSIAAVSNKTTKSYFVLSVQLLRKHFFFLFVEFREKKCHQNKKTRQKQIYINNKINHVVYECILLNGAGRKIGI